MTDIPDEPLYRDNLIAIPQDEWERELEQNIELGLASPGETYRDYIAKLHHMFDSFCQGYHHRK
jgi:hypothetical protein